MNYLNKYRYRSYETEKRKIDVPVYLNFFNRPETFKLVFDAVINKGI